VFIDLYKSTLAYMLEDEENKFYVIDLDRNKIIIRENEVEYEPMTKPREINFDIDGLDDPSKFIIIKLLNMFYSCWI
jgi:hypothetical protein